MHVGFILDGNRRWAKKQGKNSFFGHQAGIKNFEEISEFCVQNSEINEISAFALSTENLKNRTKIELRNLFAIFSRFVKKNQKKFLQQKTKVKFLGNLDLLPKSLQQDFFELEKKTAKILQPNLKLNLAVAFGGRDDIFRAAEKLKNSSEKFCLENLEKFLDSGGSNLDLLIRTGGKNRISNFMLWESAYCEIFFSEKLWPDFKIEDLQNAINFFKKTKRNFGK